VCPQVSDSNSLEIQRGQRPNVQDSGWAPASRPAPDGINLRTFVFAELAHATNNFDRSMWLGGGGFGSVFRARGLRGFPSSQQFAVKRLDPDSIQGKTEFDQEIQVLGSCRHECLLPLIGFSTDSELCLVFPLMQASLQDRLFPPDGRDLLGWEARVRACVSAAKALLYLHTPDPDANKPVILHRDIKPPNLLLDADGLVRLGDFGLAKTHHGAKPHLTLTQVGGTNGFIDPTYMQTGHYEPASDAFSLGVTVLVILTGWEAFESGEGTVYDRCDGREASEVADPRVQWPPAKAAEVLRVGMGLADPRRRFRMTVAEALAALQHQEAAPLNTEVQACVRECVFCISVPRAVRFGCGHATYCRECLDIVLSRPDPVCPHCRRPVVTEDIVEDDAIAVEHTWVRPFHHPI